ncbi:MAG TPA: hypothetical protein VKB68_22265 [Stellaceae bacterium]|nr:hypothetical protein [Stellaceae bacterium]
MLAVTESDLRIRPERVPRARMGPGLLGSLALHGVAALLILFLLPSWLATPPAPAEIVPIDLVSLGARTAAPPADQQAALPQEQAAQTADTDVAHPVPAPNTPPPPQVVAPKARASTAPPPLAAVNPDEAMHVPKPGPSAAAKPRPSSPADELTAKLQSLARLRQPAPPIPPDPGQRQDKGVSNVTASSANAAPSAQASYSVIDFLRVQVERHWYWDRRRLGAAGEWVVSIHVLLNRDGSVAKAEIVDDPRHNGDPAYHDLALSARNAVLLSSPLNLPPGRYENVKDVTLTLDPRTASQ